MCNKNITRLSLYIVAIVELGSSVNLSTLLVMPFRALFR